jgi:hypothetical protein
LRRVRHEFTGLDTDQAVSLGAKRRGQVATGGAVDVASESRSERRAVLETGEPSVGTFASTIEIGPRMNQTRRLVPYL